MHDLISAFENCPLFAGLDDIAVRQARDGAGVREMNAGEIIWKAGDPCSEVLVVIEGKLGTMFDRGWGEERILEEIVAGGMAGDVEVLNGDHCMADVKALVDSRALCLSPKDFEHLLQSRPEILRNVSKLARSKTCRLLIARHLNELFGISQMKFSDETVRRSAEQEWLDFEQDILVKLEETADLITLKRGEYLFRQGDAPDDAYVLVSGLLQVGIDGENGQERDIARIRQGEILGEMALITDDRRSASISALRDCELFRLPAQVFALVSERYPRNVLNVYRTVTKRFRESISSSGKRELTSTIAMLPASPGLDLPGFTVSFVKELSKYDSVEHLGSLQVDHHMGRQGIANSEANESANLRLVEWLNGRELLSGHLLYQADQDWSSWNARCLRQADRVVVVAHSADNPDLSGIRSRLSGAATEWSLVLLHPADTDKPVGTARWLAESSANAVYHVREGNGQDMARLARILSGRAISLVLGGGGARGFAHLGVLQALEELGITVDMVGGTSIGAPIGGWLAQGKTARECLQEARRAFKSLIDVTLPATAILSGKRISRMIEQQAGGRDLEDFWLPFFCVSTNLTLSKIEVHRSGSAMRAVRSSVSIPGVLPPVPEGEDLLVDGGVLNNLPIDIMREINPSGQIIAIDVVLPQSFSAEEDYGLMVSGWKQLLAKIIPGIRGARTPGFANVIMQSMMVGSSHSRERLLEQDDADYYQNIHVHDVGILQFESIDQAAEIGYRESIGPLREWKESQSGLLGNDPELSPCSTESR